METSTQYVVLDTNVICAAIVPEKEKNERVRKRSFTLLQAVTEKRWPTLRLCTPSICITESQSVLDKFRFCNWTTKPSKRPALLNKRTYERAKSKLARLLDSHAIEIIHLENDHVLAASLISPINQKDQFRRKTQSKKSAVRIKHPMGGTDCAIVGSAIMLGVRVGTSNVSIATKERRMADVIHKARSMSASSASKLGLRENATRLGLTWSPTIYPECVNLMTATDSQLKAAFQAWPLPSRPVKAVTTSDLTDDDENALRSIYFTCKEKTRVGVDKLPYSQEINQIRAAFANRTGKYLSNEAVYTLLSRWRKANKLKP